MGNDKIKKKVTKVRLVKIKNFKGEWLP